VELRARGLALALPALHASTATAAPFLACKLVPRNRAQAHSEQIAAAGLICDHTRSMFQKRPLELDCAAPIVLLVVPALVVTQQLAVINSAILFLGVGVPICQRRDPRSQKAKQASKPQGVAALACHRPDVAVSQCLPRAGHIR
jgi:hypothetical protein